MRLAVFIKWQTESDNPFMCINPDHSMPLVPFMSDELVVELRCFTAGCDYKLIPGLLRYKEILDKQLDIKIPEGS